MRDGAVKARPEEAEIQGFFCPLRSGKCMRTDLGLEKRCPKCDCFWPMDTEFWFPSKTEDGLFNWCRACYIRQRWPLRGAPVRGDVSPVLPELLQLFRPGCEAVA